MIHDPATKPETSAATISHEYAKLTAQDAERMGVLRRGRADPRSERSTSTSPMRPPASFVKSSDAGTASGLVAEDLNAEVAKLKSREVTFETHHHPA